MYEIFARLSAAIGSHNAVVMRVVLNQAVNTVVQRGLRPAKY